MKLTTKGRYAVSAMADIAAVSAFSDCESPVSLSDVADRQGISLSYLEQLFLKLRRAGLVTSARGASGGYALAAAPADIYVADIVSAVDEAIKTTACVRGSDIGCSGTSTRCLTHDLWDELGLQIEMFLNAVSLEDVVKKRVRGMAAVNAPTETRGRVSVAAPTPSLAAGGTE
ncbi:MAG: Rrf2 family transcriptional regulator [Pseudomonadota bacterium]